MSDEIIEDVIEETVEGETSTEEPEIEETTPTDEILTRIKRLLGFGDNNYQDETLTEYIEVVKTDLINSGVLEEVANSRLAVGAITRGVLDSWNYGLNSQYSSIFNRRVIQLREITIEELNERLGDESGNIQN